VGGLLPADARIAVVANDAIGNFVVSTPLLQMLRVVHGPVEIDYYGGVRTRELELASDIIDCTYPLHGTAVHEASRDILIRISESGPYDLVINIESTAFAKAMTALLATAETWVVGPCLNEGRGDLPFADDAVGRLAGDPCWISDTLLARYPFLHSSFIGEIFCRLAYLEGEPPPYRVPMDVAAGSGCDVIVAPSASLPEKLWPQENWVEVLRAIKTRGCSIGLVGAKPGEQERYWRGADVEETLLAQGLVHDLRGRFTLPQVVGLLDQAKVVLGVDNGILHLACATSTKTVGLFRRGIHRLWAAPSPGLTVLTHGEGEGVQAIPVATVEEALSRVF
jgi:ADP-heptose:LPS heptosyltransferase